MLHLHFSGFSSLDYRHCFASVDSVGCYGVTIQISNWFHGVGPSIQLNFIRFHHFLNGLSNITQSDINSSFLSEKKVK